MILIPDGDCLTVHCPAKVNLFLETRGVRPDGYHEIETVMQAVTLYDRIVLRPTAGGGITFRCSDSRVPGGKGNLAYRAAELLQRESGLPAGVSVTLEKQIPAGAGLGGGSSDAAGVLAGLNRLFGLGLSRERLSELAAQLGSDVTFFLRGGTALCQGRGERVTPVTSNLAAHYVICCPRRTLSTAEIYRNVSRLNLTTGNRKVNLILSSLAQGEHSLVSANLFNRLEEVALLLAPEVARAKDLLTSAASEAALVSGSGSAVYVLLDSEARALAVAERVRARCIGRTFVAQTEQPGY